MKDFSHCQQLLDAPPSALTAFDPEDGAFHRGAPQGMERQRWQRPESNPPPSPSVSPDAADQAVRYKISTMLAGKRGSDGLEPAEDATGTLFWI